MNKKLLIAAPLALAAGAVLSSPASAAPWVNPGQVRAEIAQLDRQIDRTRGLSPREQARLEHQVDRLQVLYRSYARGGFTRGEVARLNGEVAQVKSQLFKQSHDFNGRNDRHGRDRHDYR